jgi:rhodanese-related sulfurtransferase
MSLRTPEAAVSISTISASEFGNLCRIRGEIELIDVRTPAEYREAHLEIARNLPLDRLDPTSLMRARNGAGEPLYIISQSGGRGRQACEKFLKAGFTNVINI